ncbi:signal transduction histidine kinase/DNA-binding response OmpR family regulator/CHASE3 domain sensor protein [Paraburkholderia sp. HC6.4b]|nr:signal transduction histidine kinase/DNA-binding response OmpR family regulator/CHASE3 domain sensor protein [Paraburkholderia sp. HC6.4b]MBB5451475.1 signal transduction histidine kinase/DNA-binding response OmpR family regulator/CHASE3 domain sensor protein [Paraburkholderia sp. Kb1A]
MPLTEKMTASPAVDQLRFRRILRRNIALPLGVGLVTMALFVGLIAYLVSTMNWAEHSGRVIGDANEMLRLAVDRESSMRGFLITGNESFLAPYENGGPKFKAQLEALKKQVADNPPQIERLKQIEASQERWSRFAEQIIDARRRNQDYESAIAAGRGKLEFDETRREFGDFLDVELRLRQQRVEATRNVTATLVGVFLLFSLVVSGLLAWRGRRELLDLSETYDDVLRRQAEQTALLEQQVWLRSGQRLLADKVVGQTSAPLVGRAMLEFLAQYLDALVAALYVRDRQSGTLRRIAAYGYSRDSEQTAALSFEEGETLVGQAARSRRTLVLRDVPADYVRVVSATGSGAPRNLLILPIDNDGQVNGVVEMGFLREVTPRDEEFMELIRHSMGNFLEAALYRERLQDALAETQQLNEELQVQQEELRVSNEGLEERGRALLESQRRLEAQQAELEQTNVRLEEYALRLERQKSDLLRVQNDLAANAERLEQSSRYKSEFLANMSHELRTPLNSSLILAKLLQQNRSGNLTDEQVRYAETIHASNSDLLVLINDILDLSKVEAGQLTVEHETVSIEATLQSLEEMVRPIATTKHLRLAFDKLPGTPDTFVTDGQRLTQILRNLLSNAVKFTERGEVTLEVARVEDNVLRFDVRDSGIGIPADKLDLIFEAFQQADGSTSRQYGGSGLGLSISREFSRLLGGRITVASEVGKGSVFSLWLPLDAREARVSADSAPPAVIPPANGLASRAPPTASREALLPGAAEPAAASIADDRDHRTRAGRLIVAVEDDPPFAAILRDLVHELDFDFVHASDAASGLALVRDMRPAAVLLDVGLPDRSGLTVLEWLKNDPLTRHIPIHIVSATDHADKALHLGAIGYTLKPTARSTMEAAIRRLEARLQQRLKRVLVIEDDAPMRESIRALLQSENTEIVAVATLAEAFEQLSALTFDCVVTDLALPDGTGYDLLERLAANSAHASLPVIVYTGRMLSDEEEHRLRRYSKSIIIKGAKSPERLLDEVTLFLHSVESSLAPEQQRMLRTVRQRDNAFEGRTILLAEDDVRNIFALSHVLEPLGAKLLIARNGREALDELENGPEVHLVLMDIMMPEMDGLTAMGEIRRNPRFAHLPIIALTAKAMANDRTRCLEAGADDYVSKPIDVDKLVALCRVWLRQR